MFSPGFRIFLAGLSLLLSVRISEAKEPEAAKKKIAAIVTCYYHNSHADVLLSRIFQTHTYDGKGEWPELQLASLYTDQVPVNDLSRKFSEQYRFPICKTVAEALTLGTKNLAVDGVFLIAEHGDYSRSETGQIQWPKRRLFEEIVKVFRESKRVVPVFIDKHIADNWEDANWIYSTAKELKIPLMAGSSLPEVWRYPEADVRRGAELQEVVGVSYHTLDAYGFHALEMLQCLVERRGGGETGVKSVQCFTGDAVWEAGEKKVYDQELLNAALARLERKVPVDKKLKDLIPEPVLFVIDYSDGLRASILTLNYAVGEWSIAWRYKSDQRLDSTLFWVQEARPFMHFTYLFKGIEKMVLTGKPTWPAERTLLTSGVLDALLISKKEGGKRVETPHLTFSYQNSRDWRQPPPPPPGRPIEGQ